MKRGSVIVGRDAVAMIWQNALSYHEPCLCMRMERISSEGSPWGSDVLLAYVDQNITCCSLTDVLVGSERAYVKEPLRLRVINAW